LAALPRFIINMASLWAQKGQTAMVAIAATISGWIRLNIFL
jgi:hypothetical protein